MKTVTIDPVTRIEGHAKVRIFLNDDGGVQFAGMYVQELRGFEKIMTGMEVEKAPLITSRICGVCPAAHHLVGSKTLDRVFGVEPPPAGHMLRELMYMGHFIHSHALSIFVLSGPDLILGLDAAAEQRNVVGLVQANPDVAQKALRLRSLGQLLLEDLGGRGVHPVTCVVGGVSFRLSQERREKLLKMAREALQITQETAGFVTDTLNQFMQKYADLYQQMSIKTHYMGTVRDGALNLYDGMLRVVDGDGQANEFPSTDYASHLLEDILEWSYMKPVHLRKNDGSAAVYRVGPLARINACDRLETPLAQKYFEEFRKSQPFPSHNTLLYHHTRFIEMLYCCEKAVQLLENDAILGESRTPVPSGQKPQNAIHHIEAPRGTLMHDYQVSEDGTLEAVNLIVATQHNYTAINESVKRAAGLFVHGTDQDLLNGVEFAIRCYDPCLSCATHAVGAMPLDIEVIQNEKTIRHLRRDVP